MHIVFVQMLDPIFPALPGWHEAHLAGKAPAPLQYRFPSFYIPELLTRTGLSLVNAYLLWRFVCLAGTLYLAGQITRVMVREPMAPYLIILSIGMYYAPSIGQVFQFAEEPNLLAFAAFVLLERNPS